MDLCKRASAATAASLSLLGLFACATPAPAPPPPLAPSVSMSVSMSVPPALQPPAGEIRVLEAHARGVQIYECQPGKDDPSRYAWTLKAPEAELFDEHGTRIGRHYAGPTWESNDGSKVVGEVKARADAPTAGAIPWVLLSVKTASGTGVFAATQSIQRVATEGGAAPAAGCSAAAAGQTVRVPYRATYDFYAAPPAK